MVYVMQRACYTVGIELLDSLQKAISPINSTIATIEDSEEHNCNCRTSDQRQKLKVD